MGILTTILPWLDPIGSIAESLAGAYAERQNAETEQQRVEAEVRIKQLELRQEILIAEAGWWGTRWIRPAFAYPLAFYLGKIWVWDKALGLGASDPVDENLLWVMVTIIGFYFLGRPVEKAVKIISSRRS